MLLLAADGISSDDSAHKHAYQLHLELGIFLRLQNHHRQPLERQNLADKLMSEALHLKMCQSVLLILYLLFSFE